MQQSPATGLGLGLALLSAVTFATSGTFARSLIEDGWSAPSAVIARVGIAALVLAAPALLSLRGRWHVLRRNIGVLGVFGLLGVALAQVCFFNAVRYLPVGVALLLEYLGIILVVGWTWLVHGQRPRRLTVAGAAAALAGLVFVLDLTGAGRLDPLGVLWGSARPSAWLATTCSPAGSTPSCPRWCSPAAGWASAPSRWAGSGWSGRCR